MSFFRYYVIPVGDWRGDIHTVCEEFTIETTCHKVDIMKAYRQSEKKFNMTMDKYGDEDIKMLTDDYCLTTEAIKVFEEHGVNDLPKVFDGEGVATLFMEFAKLSNPHIHYDFAWGHDGEWLFGTECHGDELLIGMGARIYD